MPIDEHALERWLLRQAVAWALIIPVLAWWMHAQGLEMTQFVALGGAACVGHVCLVRALGAGGTMADRVTLGRGVLLLACTGIAWHHEAVAWLPWIGIGLALLGDLLDGFCARRFGATEAGATLDMETDQSTTLLLAFLLLGCQGVGAWVLLLPGLRYAYILMLTRLGISNRDPKPCDGDNRRAKLICALMMVLLFTGLCPFANQAAAELCAGVSLLLLVFSYGSDVRFLLRRRRAERVR